MSCENSIHLTKEEAQAIQSDLLDGMSSRQAFIARMGHGLVSNADPDKQVTVLTNEELHAAILDYHTAFSSYRKVTEAFGLQDILPWSDGAKMGKGESKSEETEYTDSEAVEELAARWPSKKSR